MLSISGLFLLALIGLGLRLLTPKQPPAPTPLTHGGNPDGSQTTFLNLQYTGEAVRMPASMWVARAENVSSGQNQTLLNSLISAFSLEPSPYVANLWTGKTHTLEYSPETNEYRLSQILTKPTNNQTIVMGSIAQLTTRATEEVKRIFPSFEFSSFPSQTKLLVGNGEFEPANINGTTTNATHIRVPFGPSYYQTPVILSYEQGYPVEVVLDANGMLVKLVARPFSATFTPQTQHPTLTIDEALQQIEQGNASIIDSFSPQTIKPIQDKIVRGEFTSATLEYRLDQNTNLIIPYYHFVGTLVNQQNDLFSADVITPAVRLSE